MKRVWRGYVMVSQCYFPSRPPPAWCRFPAGGCCASVSLLCTNPALFPLCQYTSKLLSCKVTSEVLFHLFVLVFLHAWPRCMLLWLCHFLMCSRRQARKQLVSVFLSSSLFGTGDFLEMLGYMQQGSPLLCFAVLCGGAGEDLALLMDLESVRIQVSSGVDSKDTLVLVRKQYSSRGLSR